MLKKICCVIIAITMVLTVFAVKINFTYETQIINYYESVTSSINNVLLYDVVNDKILFSKNTDMQISMGSVVKLVTALTASEILSPKDTFIVGEEVDYYLTADASRSMIKNGQTVTFEILLHALLLPSGCDAANTIAVNSARTHSGNPQMPVEDALKYFVNLMNEYTIRIGCKNSFFINPDGQDAEGQHMTLEDVLLIAKKVLENEHVLKITGTPFVTYTLSTETETDVYEWQNTNKLLNPDESYFYEHAKGLKTGYTLDAGYALVSLAERNDARIICMVAKCSSDSTRFNAAKKLCQLSLAHCEYNTNSKNENN